MKTLEDRLHALSARPPAAPTPVGELEDRALTIRRRRRGAQAVAGLAVGVLLVVGLGAAAELFPPRPEVVFDQPHERIPEPPEGWVRTVVDGLSLNHPEEWMLVSQTPAGTDSEVVLANRDLPDRDARLAGLARPDVRFSADFPRDGVVFVVGGDPLVAPPAASGPVPAAGDPLLPPPAASGTVPAVGSPTPLPLPEGFTEPILARRAHLFGSVSTLAAYIGPEAPPADVEAVDDVAASIRLLPDEPPDPGDPPPPPEGMGVAPEEQDQWRDRLRHDVASLPLDDDEDLIVREGDGCVGVFQELRPPGSGDPVGAEIPDPLLEVVCDQPAVADTEVIMLTQFQAFPRTTWDPETMPEPLVIVARVGAAVTDVQAEHVDGTSAPFTVADGYAVVATTERPWEIVAFDSQGEELQRLDAVRWRPRR